MSQLQQESSSKPSITASNNCCALENYENKVWIFEYFQLHQSLLAITLITAQKSYISMISKVRKKMKS